MSLLPPVALASSSPNTHIRFPKKKKKPTHTHTHTRIRSNYEIKAPRTCWYPYFSLFVHGNIILTLYSYSSSLSPSLLDVALLFPFAIPHYYCLWSSPHLLSLCWLWQPKRKIGGFLWRTDRTPPPPFFTRCCGECGFPVTDPPLCLVHLFLFLHKNNVYAGRKRKERLFVVDD